MFVTLLNSWYVQRHYIILSNTFVLDSFIAEQFSSPCIIPEEFQFLAPMDLGGEVLPTKLILDRAAYVTSSSLLFVDCSNLWQEKPTFVTLFPKELKIKKPGQPASKYLNYLSTEHLISKGADDQGLDNQPWKISTTSLPGRRRRIHPKPCCCDAIDYPATMHGFHLHLLLEADNHPQMQENHSP